MTDKEKKGLQLGSVSGLIVFTALLVYSFFGESFQNLPFKTIVTISVFGFIGGLLQVHGTVYSPPKFELNGNNSLYRFSQKVDLYTWMQTGTLISGSLFLFSTWLLKLKLSFATISGVLFLSAGVGMLCMKLSMHLLKGAKHD